MQPKVSRRSLLAGGALTLNPALPARTADQKPAPHKLKVDIVDTQTPFAEDILKTMASLNSRYQACAMYHTHSGAGVVGASIWDLYVLLKHFDPNAVGVNYDVGHATIEGGLGGWIDSFRITEPHLRGIAVKDFIWAKDAGGNWQAHAISGNCAHIWPRPTYSGTDAFVCQPGDHPRHRMRRFTHKPSYLEPRHILGLQRVRGIFRPFLAPRHPATVLLAIQSNRRMLQFLLPAVLAAVAFAADPLFELSGQLLPPRRASVSIFATRSPFTATAQCDAAGRFTFKNLQPDDYTVAVFIAGRGEARRTVEVSPAAAGSHRRVSLTLGLKDSDFESAGPVPQHSVSVNQLAIPNATLRQYQQAQKDLERRNPDAAAKRLQNAVEIAPQFAMAWNELGTIAYQTRKFDRAEECFRQALQQDPRAFEPLVNLGGVLVTVHKLDEAADYNLQAVLTRPNDALANSQLGLTYFELARMDLAQKYLERTRQIDPAHFSHPQLLLAEIHLRHGERREAAAVLEEFLKYHPGWPQAAKMRETIAELRQ